MKKYFWNEEAKRRIQGKGNPFFGRKHSEKSKKLMRKKARQRIKEGKNKTMFKKGIHYSRITEFKKGFKHTEKFKKYMSKKLKGKNCHMWRGGIAFEPYGPEFNKKLKKQIRTRDNHTCQLCGDRILKNTKKKFLAIHHIDYNKRNNSPFNLITLCNFCNSSVNKSREEWTNHFQNKMGGINNGCS